MRSHRHIGLDFDDTLVPTWRALVDHFNRVHGMDVRFEQTTPYKFNNWNCTHAQFAEAFTRNIDEFHRPGPFAGVLETLAAWGRHSQLHVITARPACWVPAAEEWLRRHGIVVAGVHSVDDPRDKAYCAQREKISFFVEDHPVAAVTMAECGIEVVLLDAHYNQQTVHPRIRRVRDWHEIARLTS